MKIKRYFTLLREYNAVSLKYEVLKEQVKNDLFKETINKIGEPEENKRLKKENRRLRKVIKELKKEINNKNK